METKAKQRISYNWFGVKRPYPHYPYYLTKVEENSWVVQDTVIHSLENLDYVICHSELQDGKFIDLMVHKGDGIVPNDVIEAVLRYIKSQHFGDWVAYLRVE